MRPTRETAGNLRIVWFGEERVVEVVIDLDSKHGTIDAREPVALIGTALLEPARLTIDFQRQSLSLRLAR